MYQRGRPTRRAGFSFVELLMVIGIIALLAALLLAGISKVLSLQARTEAMSDIQQMAQSLEAAKSAYSHIELLPSRLVLHNDVSKYTASNADAATKATANVLRYMFGKRFISNGTTVAWPISGNGTNASATLQGQECLVFYLGGMPDSSGGSVRFIGFAKNATNPTDASTTDRIGPFFNFKPHRLAAGPSGYYVYRDAFGKNQPFAFFGPTSINTYNDADCSNLGLSSPYFVAGSSPKKYFNANKYQIISAGPDGKFGTGGGLNPTTGSGGGDTEDNLTNFSSTELGNPVE